MAKKFKFITIKEHIEVRFPNIKYKIYNNKSGISIGWILYEPAWKLHVFSQSQGAVIWSSGCLENIVSFLKELDGNN